MYSWMWTKHLGPSLYGRGLYVYQPKVKVNLQEVHFKVSTYALALPLGKLQPEPKETHGKQYNLQFWSPTTRL